MKNSLSSIIIIVFINRAVNEFDALKDWKDTGKE